MKTKQTKWITCLLLGMALGAAGAAPAQECAAPWQCGMANDSLLEAARGGLDLGGGLMMSLGIERVVSLNGDVLSSHSLNIADVSKLDHAQAAFAGSAISSLNLLQNGAGNVFLPGAMGALAGGTLIQNSLDNQLIRTQTTINASLNSLELLKAMNFQNTWATALSNGVGQR